MNPETLRPSFHSGRFLPAVSAALAAAGLIGMAGTAQAQLVGAGDVLINVDATATALGPLPNIPNTGTLGGFLEALGGGATIPEVAVVNGNGTRGIRFDGGDFLQHVATLGGPAVSADPTLTGVNPTCSIEAWVLNPGLSQEETIVSWGHRGGPDGANMSFNYGWDAAWGAIGHWGGADIGWDTSASAAGINPQGNPISGVWHHLVYTFDGTTQRVYTDGVLKNSENISLNTYPLPPVTIGAQMDNDTVVTGGLRGSMTIARLRIHSEALTPGQVANNYNFEAGGFDNGGAPLPFGPSHRYSFNNPSGAAASGSVISDSIGTAHGTVLGNGATFTGSRLTVPGGSSATAAYVDLPNGLLSSHGVANGGSGEITIEGFVKNNGTRNWSRIYDFGNGSAGELTGPGGSSEGRDYVFLSATEGTNPHRHNTSIRNLIAPTGSDTGIGWDTANANRDYHFALTWQESTAQIRAYENGSLVSTVTYNPATDTMSSIEDVNVWLGRSNWTGDENFQGEYDEFRIYPRVLPPEQIRASFVAGPNNLATADPVSIGTQPQDQVAQELGSATFSAVALGFPPLGYQWFQPPSTPIPGATASSYTLNAIPLSANGSQYFLVASNFIPGTGSFFATSQVATLTVVADMISPTLVSAAAAGTTNIVVTFSEPINASDAGNAANFTVSAAGTNIAVLAAAPGGSPTRVRLTIGAQFGCAYYIVTVNGVRDVSTAANVIAANSRIGFLSLGSSSLTHRYTFNNDVTGNATGAIVEDLAGTAHADVKGAPTSLTGTRVTLGGGSSATAAYIDLANGLLSGNSTNNGGSGKVTFEGWVKVTGNRNWSRIVDFGSSVGGELLMPGGGGQGLDYLFYSAQIGTDVNRRRIDFTNLDPTDEGATGSEFTTTTFNQDCHFVITWDEATGEIRVYENGVFKTSTVTDDPMSDVNDVNVWLGRSNWTNDENMQGEFDEFRTYNRVMSPAEVTQNTGLGPDNAVGEPQSIDVNVPSMTMNFPGPTQQATAVVHFAGGVNLDLTASGCILFESSDPSVLTVSPAGVLSVVTGGVATVTASFNGLMGSKVITVLEDTNGPTLVRARVNSPTAVEVVFNEVVDSATATDAGVYTVIGADGPVAISTVELHPSADRVTINLASRLPCGLVTVEVSFVTDTAPRMNEIAPNSRISTYYLVINGLQHRYSFNSTPAANASGAIIPDLAGTGDGDVKGNGSALLGSRLRLNGGPSGSAAYVDLPNGLLSINSTNNGGLGGITLEGWVKITGARGWSRIFDFGSSDVGGGVGGEQTGPGGGGAGLDYLMLSAEINGTDTSFRRTEIRNEDPAGGGAGTVDHATAGFNNDTHFAVTWDEATGRIRTYENGAQVSTMVIDDALSQINDVNVWLGRSNWAGDQNAQGEFDEFRVHGRVMPASEVAFSAALGPDPNFGTLNSVVVTSSGPITAPGSQQLGFFAIFSNVPGLDLTGTLCVRYSSSDPTILTVGPTGIAQGLRCGSATVTAWVAGVPGTSNTVTVSVLNCPPTARDDGGATLRDRPVVIPIAKLLRNDSDVDGDPITFVSASATSTNGASVVVGMGEITYTPQPGFTGVDRFSYTIEGGGLMGSADVEILVVAGSLPSQNQISLTVLAGGAIQVRFAGIPGRTYQIDRATAVIGPWSTIATLAAPLHGIIEFEDASPPMPSAFYRTSVP